MSATLFSIFNYDVSLWHIVGFLGFCMFSLRWLIQIIASARAGRSILPVFFWYASIAGSSLLILYFLFGTKDPIGVLSSVSPLLLACYNLYLISKRDKQADQGELI